MPAFAGMTVLVFFASFATDPKKGDRGLLLIGYGIRDVRYVVIVLYSNPNPVGITSD
jgi:hypothetical protein